MRRSGNKEENKRILMDLDVVLKSHDCPYIVQCFGTFITNVSLRPVGGLAEGSASLLAGLWLCPPGRSPGGGGRGAAAPKPPCAAPADGCLHRHGAHGHVC